MRAVLFDFYGTLAHATTWGPTYEEVLAGHGVDLSDDVRHRFGIDALDGHEHVEHSVTRDAYVRWEKHRLTEMVVACGVGVDDAAPLVDDLWEAGKAWTMAPYPEVPDVLRALRARRVRVAVCSNWDWDLARALDAAALTSLIDVAVTSAQAGARKPHRRIFERTLEAADVEPHESLFVGDSWHADVEGPRALGITPVHVHRDDDHREPPHLPSGVHRLRDLRGVLELV